MTTPFAPERDPEEAQKVAEILLILEQLVEREDVTVRFLMERLYDIGCHNLLKQKCPSSAWVEVLRPLLRLPRSGFRWVATRWFQAHGPRLITQWLHSLVMFKSHATAAAAPDTLDTIAQPLLPPGAIATAAEIRQLRAQMRWLMTLVVSAIAILGSSIFWLDYQLKPAATEFLQQVTEADVPIGKR